jgi:hypothetical protein
MLASRILAQGKEAIPHAPQRAQPTRWHQHARPANDAEEKWSALSLPSPRPSSTNSRHSWCAQSKINQRPAFRARSAPTRTPPLKPDPLPSSLPMAIDVHRRIFSFRLFTMPHSGRFYWRSAGWALTYWPFEALRYVCPPVLTIVNLSHAPGGPALLLRFALKPPPPPFSAVR